MPGPTRRADVRVDWLHAARAGNICRFRQPRSRHPARGALHTMIIQSLLDTDLYKFTMMQVVLHHFPAAQVEYRFKCRNANADLTPYISEIRDEIRALCGLRFRAEELSYLRGWRFF